jgi:DNA-binding beta-propeller fold protein YncE
MAAAVNRRPQERERLVAKGAAAPVESPTVTASARPGAAQPAAAPSATHLQPEPETRVLEPRSRRPVALVAAGLVVAVAAAVAATLTLGKDDNSGGGAAKTTPTATPTPTATATAVAAKAVDEITVGNRPNLVRIAGDTVFVGSFRSQKMALVSAKTGKVRSYGPKIGVGSADTVKVGDSLWVAVSRSKQIVRLSAKTGRPIGNPIQLPYGPNTIVYAKGALWAGLVPGNELPDQLVRIDPKTGQVGAPVEYPYGIYSLTASPSAIWMSTRRRAQILRVDPRTGTLVKTLRIGRSRTQDLVYSRGWLWAATPEDDTVYRVNTSTGDPIPISVGQSPRQLAVTRDSVYVTNYNSSDLTVIDTKSSRVVGDPLDLSVNPYSLAASSDGKTLWVGSPPDNRVTKIATGRGG